MPKGVGNMRKTYTYGEILLLVREEYLECRKLLNQMLECIKIDDDYQKAYLTANLKDKGRVNNKELEVMLKVEKKCSLLNKITFKGK